MTILLGLLASFCIAYAVRWAWGRVTGRRQARSVIERNETMTDEEYRKAAREQYGDEGQIEIDDEAPVSSQGPGPDMPEGAYVQAWVWVANLDYDDKK